MNFFINETYVILNSIKKIPKIPNFFHSNQLQVVYPPEGHSLIPRGGPGV